MSCNGTGDVDLSGEILHLMDGLYMSEEQSDVTLLIGGVKIPAHKFILSTRSSYFQRLFCGSFAEASQTEIALEVPLEALKVTLRYIYTGRISLAHLKLEQLLEVCGLAEQYYFESLKQAISSHLIEILSLENCCAILNAARLYSLEKLQSKSLEFIDIHCSGLLIHDTFKTLSQETVCCLLGRNTFYAPEIEIFNAVWSWYTDHPNADVEMVFSGIRWSEMSSTELLNAVSKGNILDTKHMLEVISGTVKSGERKRSVYLEAVNVASVRYGAKVIECGGNPSALLDVDFWTYDFKKSNASHCYIDILRHRQITIQLGKVHNINHIKFLIRGENSGYAYRIDTSLEGTEYKTVIDYTKCASRSWQDLYFPSRFVRYIRLVGTGLPQNGYVLQIFGLVAMYRIEQPELIDGFIKPSCNVATVEKCAYVKQGAGENNMLDRYSEEFTCHEIGSGAIVVQFNQPYWVDSVGLLLGNDRYHSYKYSLYIETSMNAIDWTMAVDKRDEQLTSWQRFNFDSRVAAFIKIVGTQEDVPLICTYFECPSLQ